MVPITCSLMLLDMGRCIGAMQDQQAEAKTRGTGSADCRVVAPWLGLTGSFAQCLGSQVMLPASEILMSRWRLTPKPERTQTGHWLGATGSSAMQQRLRQWEKNSMPSTKQQECFSA